ncbi:hypothetical protein TSAR_001856 [Trichomalopsis sarcophagae]|uniref:Uncharacterized protein n=1 Tax=Trichomalopsis sarcophagae TaxID=543379 RepID=A0A232EM16_9HYME|nr:hypothetical protein TSAR_001856 [Trichomalopsis sarcophagae]
MVHLLYGGDKSRVATHNKYLVRVGSLDNNYWCNIQALDQNIICADVPTVTEGSWLQELKSLNLFWSDSTTVVTWLNKVDNWSIFVANRVKEIREITEPGQ